VLPSLPTVRAFPFAKLELLKQRGRRRLSSPSALSAQILLEKIAIKPERRQERHAARSRPAIRRTPPFAEGRVSSTCSRSPGWASAGQNRPLLDPPTPRESPIIHPTPSSIAAQLARIANPGPMPLCAEIACSATGVLVHPVPAGRRSAYLKFTTVPGDCRALGAGTVVASIHHQPFRSKPGTSRRWARIVSLMDTSHWCARLPRCGQCASWPTGLLGGHVSSG